MIRPPLFGWGNTCKIVSFIGRILHTIVKVTPYVLFFLIKKKKKRKNRESEEKGRKEEKEKKATGSEFIGLFVF